MKLFIYSLILLPICSFAQTPEATPAVVNSINSFFSFIPSEVPTWLIVAVGFLVEIIMRLVPTAQPRSVLLLGSLILKAVASGLNRASEFLDKIIPNVKK